MKNRILFTFLLGMAALWTVPALSATLTAARMKALGLEGKAFTKKAKGIWNVEGGIMVYNTEVYAPKVLGFGGPVPLFIAVNAKGIILAVAAAPNDESYFDMIEDARFLHRWDGKSLKEAAKMKPDAVTGATYTSDAIVENVRQTARKLTSKKE